MKIHLIGQMNNWKTLAASVVAHAHHPSYSRGGNQEDHCLRPDQAKSSWDPTSTNSWVPWLHTCHPSYCRKHK
jgi:hypothetical protein